MNSKKKASKKHKVLLTGAGGAALPMLINSLRSSGFIVHAADMDPFAAGLYIADKGFVIPPGLSPDFVSAIRTICKKENIGVFVPLVDEELVPATALEKAGIIVITPKKAFIESCLDKYTLMNKLRQAGISVPHTRLASQGFAQMKFPVIIKPRSGRGSRDVKIAHTKLEAQGILQNSKFNSKDFIIQEFIDGKEYTVSAVVWRDGQVQAVVPKQIISKKGITRMAITKKNVSIDRLCRQVQKTLRADGPFNVQLKLEKKTGKPYIFEINPRFSTTITLTMAAGIDELGGIITQALKGKDSYKFKNWKENIVLLRQTADVFISNNSFSSQCKKIITIKR